MLVVGLTGGIASGKSTVSQLLSSHGLPIVDADLLARRVVEPGQPAYKRIVALFGTAILLRDGRDGLDRAKLGEVVFNDAGKRAKLNAIVHPAVRREMIWEVAKCWLGGHKVCIVDVPLLVEAGMWKWVGKVVVVYCSKELQLRRLTKRDSSSQEVALSRLNSQLPLAAKLDYADQVIDNSGSLQDLQAQVDALVRRLNREAGWTWLISWLIPPIGVILGVLRLSWRTMKRSRKGRGKRPSQEGGIALRDVTTSSSSE